MAQTGFVFGQGTPDTYESLQAKRRAAERLSVAALRAPQNVGEGLSALGQAWAYRRLTDQANTGEAAGREAYTGKRQSVLGMLMGGRMAGAGGAPAMAAGGVPPVTTAPVTANPAGLPQSIIDAVDRVDPQGGGQFGAIEAQYGLPTGYLDRTAQIESGGNPRAQNPNSSAAGMFQFIDSTAQAYGLQDRFDPAASADAAARLAADNRAQLIRALGREPTAAELYLAHQQGGGGASALLSNPNARAADVVGLDAVRLNGGDPNMTAGEFAGKWLNKFSGGGDTPTGGMGGGAAIPAIMELLNDPYAPEGDRMILAQLLQTQLEAMQPPDPMQALDMEYKQAQIDQMRGGGNLPDGYEAKHMTAVAGGLVPGTPEYQQFMLGSTEGEEFGLTPIWGRDKDGNPALAQLSKNGVVKQSELPEGWQPDPALNAQMQAEGRAIGAARGEAIAAAPTQIANADAALQGIAELRDHPARAWATGGTSVFNAIPGTGGMDFNSRVEQLKGGAFLTAIQQLQGMGALSNAEGATATAAVTRLSTALSEDAFLDALDDYEKIVKAGRERAEKRLPGQPTSEAPPPDTMSDDEYLKSLGLQ